MRINTFLTQHRQVTGYDYVPLLEKRRVVAKILAACDGLHELWRDCTLPVFAPGTDAAEVAHHMKIAIAMGKPGRF